MTTTEKPIRRETVTTYRGRPLIITLHARYIEVSEKGRRDSVTLCYGDLYEVALKCKARAAGNA